MLSQHTCSMRCFQREPVDASSPLCPFPHLKPVVGSVQQAGCPLWPWDHSTAHVVIRISFVYFLPLVTGSNDASFGGSRPYLFHLMSLWVFVSYIFTYIKSAKRETTLNLSLEQEFQVVTLKLIQQRIHLFLEANWAVRWSEASGECGTLDRILIFTRLFT